MYIKRLKIICLFIATLFISYQAIASSSSLYGIIIPTVQESHYLQKIISHKKIIKIDSINYITGELVNKKIVFVVSGLGKINAAIITTLLIRDFHPSLIFLTGSSGNLNPSISKGDVIIGKEVVDTDLGELTKKGVIFKYKNLLFTPQANAQLPLTFTLNKKLLNLVKKIKKTKYHQKLILGKIATSDALPNLKHQIQLFQENKFDITDMESAAFMQTCWLFKTSCIVVRGISNNANKPLTSKDIEKAAIGATQVVKYIISDYSNKKGH